MRYFSYVLMIIAFLILDIGAVSALSGDEIISLVDQHEDGYIDLSADIEMKLLDTNGTTKTRYIKFYSIESGSIGEKRKFVFNKPLDIKGTSILIHSNVIEDDKQWIYLPAFKRVKRISSSNKKTAFVGSQFSYEDLSSQEKEKYENDFLYEKQVNGIDCYAVKRTPKYSTSGYQYLVVYVDKKNKRYVKMQYYDMHGELVKTLHIDGYKLYKNRYLLASTYSMENHKTQKTTIMKWEDIKLRLGMSPSDFNKNALKRNR